MSVGNRLHRLAVRGCLIAAVILPSSLHAQTLDTTEGQQPPIEEAKPDGQTATPEHQNQSGDTPEDAKERDPVDWPISREPDKPVDTSAGDKEPEERNRYPDCPYEKVEECDLLAQQSMAKSTNYMDKAAWIGVLLSAIAVGLIWKTMKYTAAAADYAKDAVKAARDAVDEAERATRVAKDSLSETRNTAERQLRPYIVTHEPHIDDLRPGQIPNVKVTFKNTGQTPAVNAKGSVWMTLGYFPPVSDFDFPITKDAAYSTFVLAPNGTITVGGRLKYALKKDQFEAICAGKMAVYAYGTVTYDDAFQKGRETGFRLFCTSADNVAAGGVFSLSNDGNYIK